MTEASSISVLVTVLKALLNWTALEFSYSVVTSDVMLNSFLNSYFNE